MKQTIPLLRLTSTLVHPNRVVEEMVVFVQSFHEVTVLEFNGDALLRHFRSTYNAQ